MRILIDTNRYSDMDRGVRDVVERIETSSEIWLPVIVLGELYAGFEKGSQRKKNESQLYDFLKQPSVDVLAPDGTTAREYGRVFEILRQQGTPIPTNDIWIAAMGLQHDLWVYSRDSHFRHVPQLKWLDE